MIPILNPYLDLYEDLIGAQAVRLERIRKRLVSAYAFAVPSRAVLEAIAIHGPVVEMGAGTGYWAWLLRQLGVSVIAYDRNASAPPSWSEVLHGDAQSVLSDSESAVHQRALFLCWPPLGEAQQERPEASSSSPGLADEALALYQGAIVHSVGEWRGRTGSPLFHDTLERDWQLIECLALPQWPGFQDELRIWKRR